jgi:metal-responsive CopG/Arc/MetJ family transcriptional regulator
MRQRINVSLPRETIEVIDRLAEKAGLNRSQFIDRAARHFVESVGRSSMRKLLAEGARVRAKESLALAEEWSAADSEAWARLR